MSVWNDCIKELHAQKLIFNDEKLKRRGGFYNIDDHGWIPLDPIQPMEVFTDEKNGLCSGMDAISRTFASFIDSHPPYVNPNSACGGAWIGPFRARGSWKPEDRWPEHDALLEKYNVIKGGIYGMNHSGPDMRIGLELGWGGLLEKIRRYRQLNSAACHEFYDGEERVVMALQRLIERTAAHARELADKETDAWYRQNYLEIAAMNEYLYDGPPRTLREAVQWIVWYEAIDRMYHTGGAGQAIDVLLRAYYENDRQNGLLQDDDEAAWYFASLFFGDTHYHQIDGPNPLTGESESNPVSFLVLEGQHRLKIPCNLGLRIHEKTNDELFDRAVQYLFEDGTGVCYSLSGGLDEGFAKNGYPMTIARMRAKVGCNWTALPGTEYALQDVTRVCLAQPFLFALREMVESDDENTMENLYERFTAHLAIVVEAIKDGVDWHVEHKWKNSPELVLNLVMHGPIERGIDMSAGGVDIYNFACDAVAFATVANSFAAVEQRVVREKKLTWEQLLRVLDANYEGFEDVRLMLKNIPQYGAGGTRADYWAGRVEKTYTGLMRGTTSKNGFNVLPGIFSHGDVITHGEHLPATPNGRRAGEPISHSADPDPGFLPGGGTAPTAKANAVARVQSGWGNSTPLQVDIDAGMAKETGGIDNIKAFIRAHNKMGGTLLNINIIDKKKILEAHKNPDLYPDLVVRVTGYSAFFKSLSPEYRQQVVDRWLGETTEADLM